ncbi:MAG: GerMN domain-containing protein [Bacillota bacterium]
MALGAGNMSILRNSVIFLLLVIFVFIIGCAQVYKPDVKPEGSAKSQQDSNRNQLIDRKPFLVQNRETVRVYFATPDGKNLVPVTLSINPTKEAAKVAVEKLLAGPENNFSLRTIPEGTKLKDIFLQDRTVYVDLTTEIKKVAQKKNNTELALSSLVLTLTEFKEVDNVQVLIDGKIEKKLGEIEIEKPIKRPKNINYYGDKKENSIVIFYSDANAMFLVPISLGVSGKDFPLIALKKLLKGPPVNSGLIGTCLPQTKVHSLSINNGIASVDFSQEALGYSGGANAETMWVNSVVLTLTMFDQISAVQFLFNGKKIKYLPEGTDVSLPIPTPQDINFIQQGTL